MEQIVASLVSRIQKQFIEVLRIISQETLPQMLEGHVEVIQPQLPQERMQQHMMSRWQVPAVTEVQKHTR